MPAKVVPICYGTMLLRGEAASSVPGLYFGEQVILATERGTEWGTILFDWRVLGRCCGAEQKQKGAKSGERGAGGVNGTAETGTGGVEGRRGNGVMVAKGGRGRRGRGRGSGSGRVRILRRANEHDRERRRSIESTVEPEDAKLCRRLIEKHHLPMRLTAVDHLFGDEKVLFYFRSDRRVDFRVLVRDLAHELRTRIELRQIGPRDEAKLSGDYGVCGRELCCRSCLRKLEPIPMRMAKLQAPGVDPGKIYGRCGKLKCCLRYEAAFYAERKARLPARGKRVGVVEPNGESFEARVIGGDAYNERVVVCTDEGARRVVALRHIKSVGAGKPVTQTVPAPAPAVDSSPDAKADEYAGPPTRVEKKTKG